jgi:hypothetical protein
LTKETRVLLYRYQHSKERETNQPELRESCTIDAEGNTEPKPKQINHATHPNHPHNTHHTTVNNICALWHSWTEREKRREWEGPKVETHTLAPMGTYRTNSLHRTSLDIMVMECKEDPHPT